MATHGWRTGRTLKDQLIDEGASFNYFQLMHLLDLSTSTAEPDANSKSENDGASENSAKAINWRILADLEAGFPVNEIRSIELKKKRSLAAGATESEQVVARTSNYCIAGHQGPLPENYTDWLREQQRYGPSAMADFLDMFNHRINMLRYEVKKNSCLALDQRRPDEGQLAPGISASMGMLGEAMYEQLPLSKRSIMSLSGLLSGRRISARAIQRILQKCFGITAKVTDVVGAWRAISPDQLWQLGKEGVSNLGKLCVLGQKNMDMQGRIRIEMGPLSINKYLALLPDLEFSREQIQVPIRSKADLRHTEYFGRKPSYAFEEQDRRDKESQDRQSDFGSDQNSHQVGNIQLNIEPEHDKENLMVPSAFDWLSRVSRKSVLRATKFTGYLYGPFSALVQYLTNSKVDIEVYLQVDPDTLPGAYPVLCTPERPQDAYLRLGQSFWLGKPSDQENSRARFLIDGFGTDKNSGALCTDAGHRSVAL